MDGGSITVEVGLSNMRRQMNVHLFSFNIPFDGDSCFNSGASVAHLTPCFLEFGPEVVPDAYPAGGIPGYPGIRESSEEPGF